MAFLRWNQHERPVICRYHFGSNQAALDLLNRRAYNSTQVTSWVWRYPSVEADRRHCRSGHTKQKSPNRE